MAGKLYGVSVGPGDPELMTIKAKRLIEEADAIVFPVRKSGEKSTALEIVKGTSDISGKRIKELLFEMTSDKERRRSNYNEAVKDIVSLLKEDMTVAMIVLGDLSIFSTYMRINTDIRERGFDTESVPGVTSFCDGAARAGVSLTMGDENLTVVPLVGNNEKIDEALNTESNIVFMKASASVKSISDKMSERGLNTKNATVVSNVGMEGQYIGPLDTSREYGYFTTVIVKREGKKI
jgi:precorrin-2 C20-methyltransferase